MKIFEKAMEEIAKIKNEEIRKKVLRFEKFRFEDSIKEGKEYEFEMIENNKYKVIIIDEDNIAAIYADGIPGCVFLYDLEIKKLNDAMKLG